MAQGPAAIVGYILEEHPLSAAPRRLVEVICDVVLKQEWAEQRTTALEKAESWQARVASGLRSKINDLELAGRPAKVTFNSSDDDQIQGACFIEPSDSEDVRRQKVRRSKFGEYHKIIRGLNADEFERLCRRVIQLLGVETPHLTRTVADDGIDFYGRIQGESVFFPADWQPTIQKQLSIWLVGQAKQFIEVQAGTPEIRDLAGSVMLGRSGAISTERSAFPHLELRVCDPVFSILVTGGTLSARAWKLLKNSGVIGIDGELLAAFLADREAGPGDEPDPEQFREWLDEKETADEE